MIRRTALVLAATAVVIGAGCASRTASTPGSYTEGGIGTPFYAEVSYAKGEGQKPRIYLFGKVADYDKFLATKEVPEAGHKKYIGKGEHRETVVVQDLVGFELKDNPRYTDKLLAKYQARHPQVAQPAEQAPVAQ